MQYFIDNNKIIFNFSGKHIPLFEVDSGDEITFQTQDCFSNQLNTPQDKLEQLDWERINPATGPIFVKNAAKGDTLKVFIKKIEIADYSVIATGRDMGVFGSRLSENYTRIAGVKDGLLHFSDSVSLPIKPMIGVIGVAPENETIGCGVPGNHGGNMDNNMISESASVYLPIFHDGALLALGDVHAVMGDGEVCVSGAESRAKVTVVVELIKNKVINNPIVETEDFFSTVAAEETLDKAVETCVFDMADLIKRKTLMRDEEIAMLMSISGNVQICQVVDPKKTARFVMPKKVLNNIHFSL